MRGLETAPCAGSEWKVPFSISNRAAKAGRLVFRPVYGFTPDRGLDHRVFFSWEAKDGVRTASVNIEICFSALR